MATAPAPHPGGSPAPLSPSLINLYREASSPAPPDDWDALRRRAAAAHALGEAAYLRRERAAWEVAQVLTYLIQNRSELHVTEPGDVLVLDTLYRLEEKSAEAPPLPEGLSAPEFCALFLREIEQWSVAESPAIEWLESSATAADWTYVGYQFMPFVIPFTRMIALSSFHLPRQGELLAYANLWDEVSHGDAQRSHFQLFKDFAAQFGVTPEHDRVLDWCVPEILHLANAQIRMLWHRDAGWALGSMYLFERIDLVGYGRIMKGLYRLGARAMDFFEVHAQVDDGHAAAWMRTLESMVSDPARQRVVLTAGLERARLNHAAYQAVYAGHLRRSAAQAPPRCPYRELVRATGIGF